MEANGEVMATKKKAKSTKVTDPTLGHALSVLSHLPENDQLRIAACYRFQLEWNAADKKIDRFAKRLGVSTTQAQSLFDHYKVR
jgi:hypothetical protein